MKSTQPSEFELQILGILWESGPLTVRQVMEQLTDKKRAYTSVLSVLQVMQKKGLVRSRRQKEGLAHVFEARVKRERVVKPLLKGLVDRVFGGRTKDVLQHLLTDDVDPQELDDLRALLDSAEARQKRSSPNNEED